MDVDHDSATAQAAQRQVRVQLTSKQEDLALPENTGPILVPTGEKPMLRKLINTNIWNSFKRTAPLCSVYAGEQPPPKRQADSVRIFDQWHIPPDLDR